MSKKDCMVELIICFGELSKKYHFGETEREQLKSCIGKWADELQDSEEQPQSFAFRKFTEAGWIQRNTEVQYLYRDANNFKRWNLCVVQGTLTDEEMAEIWNCCDSGEYFYPNKVGLPENRYSGTDADMPWFELAGFDQTSRKPNVNITAQELLEKFRSLKGTWGIMELA